MGKWSDRLKAMKRMTIELPDDVMFDYDNSGLTCTPEAADELKKRIDVELEKAKRPTGMPEEGQKYWLVNIEGEPQYSVWQDDSMDKGRWNIGNVFLTEAECQKEIDRRKALQRVKAWIAENTEPFEPDWKNRHETKWLIFCNHIDQTFLVTDRKYCSPLSEIPLFGSSADADRFIEACEFDLRILAGVE